MTKERYARSHVLTTINPRVPIVITITIIAGRMTTGETIMIINNNSVYFDDKLRLTEEQICKAKPMLNNRITFVRSPGHFSPSSFTDINKSALQAQRNKKIDSGRRLVCSGRRYARDDDDL